MVMATPLALAMRQLHTSPQPVNATDPGPRLCPCGNPAALGERWITEWFDASGIAEYWVVVYLCADHRARHWGEAH